jgi:hypothetical protein
MIATFKVHVVNDDEVTEALKKYILQTKIELVIR